MFSHDGEEKDGTVVVCVAEIALAKGISAFCSIIKKRKKERKKAGRKKEAPHDSICFLCSSNSLFLVYRNNLHTFFPPRPTLLPDSLLVVAQGMCLAKEECFLMERNKIESTRQILEPNDFQTPHGQEWVDGRRWHGDFTRLKCEIASCNSRIFKSFLIIVASLSLRISKMFIEHYQSYNRAEPGKLLATKRQQKHKTQKKSNVEIILLRDGKNM